MKSRNFVVSICFVLTTSFFAISCDSTTRVLFIGNSLTYYNGGLDSILHQICEHNEPPIDIETEMMAQGYATLESLWQDDAIKKRIAEGNFDFVVIQGDIPESTKEAFQEYSRHFIDHINSSGAEPIVYMTWGYNRLGWINTEEIAEEHQELHQDLKVDIVPVGIIMERFKAKYPSIRVLDIDNEHPSIQGSYIAAIAIYIVIFEKNLEMSTYVPEPLTFDNRKGQAELIRLFVNSFVEEDPSMTAYMKQES